MPPTHDAPTAETPAGPTFSRRAVVAGAGAAAIGAGLLVAGCSAGSGSGSGSDGSGSSGGSASGALGPATDVPVGGAKIYGDQSVVVTQATAGTYAGFSTRCPHQGCNVNEVRGASIVCPCHGSTFALDGSVEKGPARTGLTAKAVTVDGGGRIVLG
ncbi:Rieske (2Fe-2S) protein [Pseudonocardia sp. N23]|uniref:Rieske (2Fe-2S) protein n=1 Tax=Pseudonocardia sp. N23 TaxID=1987376 RepID=UPI000BFC4877|nr:Rieske (2Fe-2S) protein [Pseudonocardia sp. N23]GAY07886.1 putative iron sulphur protein [Pseudonocardia sp. N23]